MALKKYYTLLQRCVKVSSMTLLGHIEKWCAAEESGIEQMAI